MSGKSQKTEMKGTKYIAAETALIALVTYLVTGLICHTLFELAADALLFVMWTLMAGAAFLIQKVCNTRVVNLAVFIYGIFLMGWFVFGKEEGRWQYAIMLFGGFLALQILYFSLQKPLVRLVCGFGIMTVLISCRFFEIEYSKAVNAMGIFLFLYAISEVIAIFYRGNTRFLMFVYALTALLTMVTPTREQAYDWKFVYEIATLAEKAVKAVATEIQYQLSDVTTDAGFGFQVTGYSDGGTNLLAELTEQDVEQLVLQGDYTRGNLYLKGKVCNTYTGTGWKSDYQEQQADYRTDALMMLYVIFRETEDINELNRFMEIKEQEVIFKNIKTKTLFYPLKLLAVSEKEAEEADNHLRTNKVNKRGYEYTYYFVDIDYANETVTDMLKNSKEITYEEEAYNRIYTNLQQLYHIEIEKMPFETFCRQAEIVREAAESECMEEGGFVSEKVKTLSDEVTAGLTSDYEKCKALETYLYGYRYNQSTVIPRNENVLDYFLFEGKEGYCAHYATALTAMLRSQGIPSRVAEGFLVNYKERTDIYAYSVSSRLAHVWVEAYLDGFGWVRLEPTVIYGDAAARAWYQNAQKEPVWEEEEKTAEVTEIPQINGEEFFGEEEDTPSKQEKLQLQAWLMILKLFAGMALCVAVVAALCFWYKNRMLRKSNRPDVVFERLLMRLERKYAARNKEETMKEYIDRICQDKQVPEEEKKRLLIAVEMMEDYWYGGGTVPQEELLRIKETLL